MRDACLETAARCQEPALSSRTNVRDLRFLPCGRNDKEVIDTVDSDTILMELSQGGKMILFTLGCSGKV
jgi:hypothetical protein